MARYRATEYIPGLAVEGAEFESDLVPGLAWEPLDKEARAAVKAVAVEREARIAAAKAAIAAKRNKAAPVAKPVDEFEQAWTEAVAECDALKVELADTVARGAEAIEVLQARIAELEAPAETETKK
jgi:hypothetical protein